MKLTADYDHHTQVIELRYDDEAQTVFATAAQAMTRFLNPPGSPASLEQGPDWHEDVGRNLELLTRLGAESSHRLRVQAEYLDDLLCLVCCLTPYLLACDTTVDWLRDLVLLLSRNVPLPVPVEDLPPAAEVLDRKTHPEAWKAWQKLRSAKNGQEELTLLEAYHLWFALHGLPKQNSSIETLVSTLDTFTLAFRWAMRDLAFDDVTGGKIRKEKK